MTATPAYRRVAADLRRRIAAGEFAPGSALPSRAALCGAYDVGSNVAAAAVRLLVAEGLAGARAGRGVYVRERGAASTMARSWTRERLQGVLAVCPDGGDGDGDGGGGGDSAGDGGGGAPRASGKTSWATGSASEEARTERGAPTSVTEGASPEIAERLSVPVGEPLIRSDYLLRRDGVPAMLCVSWEPLGITGGTPVSLPGAGPMAGSSVVARMSYIGIRVTRSTETVTARTATPKEAAALDLARGDAVAAIERTYYTGDRPLETADLVVPGERFRLAYEIPGDPDRHIARTP